MLLGPFFLCNLHPRPRFDGAAGIMSLRGALLSAEARLRAKADARRPRPPKLCERRRKQSILAFARPHGLLRTPVAHSRDRWLAMTMYLFPPHLARHIDREFQLRPLLFLGEEVALLGGSKAALRR